MKIDRTSLRDRIADAVRLRIVSGELRPVLGWLRGATPEEVP